jgi:hypothetical protein
VKDREGLIVLDLPAGKHNVSLEYGISKYGVIGYMTTVCSIILFSICLAFFDRFLDYLEKTLIKLALYFGIYQTPHDE